MLCELDPSGDSRTQRDPAHAALVSPAIDVRVRKGLPTITRIAPFSDAWRKDVRKGDIIFAIDDTQCAGMTIQAVNILLHGDPDSEVKIQVLRPSEDKLASVTLKRETVVADLFVRNFSGKLLYLRPTAFSDEVVAKFLSLEVENEADLLGIVLDLRGSTGGNVKTARKLSGRFLKKGTLVKLIPPNATPRNVTVIEHPMRFTTRVVVLVDEGTGVTGEILAAALQEQHRAVVMGQVTCGLGANYSPIAIDGGPVMRLPAYCVATVAGKPLFRTGVTPDIAADFTTVPKRRWAGFRHQFLALLKALDPKDLPWPGKEKDDAEDGAKGDVKVEDEVKDKEKKKEKVDEEKPEEGEAEKSLEQRVLTDYPSVRQYDRPFVRALNLLISMDIFYRQYGE